MRDELRDEGRGMNEIVERMRARTKTFALSVIALCDSLPERRAAQTIGYQVLRSATSIGAQYREACRSRSDAELISKLQSVLQEIDETSYWLELLLESKIADESHIAPLLSETDELTRMLVSAVKNIKKRH